MKKHSRILALIWANRHAMLYILVINILLLIPATLSPIFKQVFADDILGAGATNWFPVLLALMLGTAALSGVTTWLQRGCVVRLSNRIEIPRAAGYMWRLFHAPLSLLAGKDAAVLLSQADASKAVSKALTTDILSLIFSTVTVVLYLIMMLQVDAWLTLLAVLLVVLTFAWGRAKEQLKKRYGPKASGPSAADLAFEDERISSEGLQNIETFKSTASETYFFQRILGSKHALVNARRGGDYTAAYAPLKSLSQVVFLNLLLLICALRIMNHTFSIGAYLAFQAYAATFFAPLNAVLGAKRMFDTTEGKLGGLYKALGDAGEATEYELPAGGGHKLSGAIECVHVTFGYDCGTPVIEDFSLSAKPGQRIAILGKSGAGKTTLLGLLMGLHAPQGGTVALDGVAPQRLDRGVMLASVGMADQQPALFTASVKNNISMWDESVSQADIYRAAGDAFIHDDIAALERGYGYHVAENGHNFSGGQRQKLELARALLYNPSILLLDEATSSIDRATRERIERMLVRRGCTCVVATHLVTHITDYDEIIVLEGGRVAQRGTHAQLLESSPYYASIYKAESEAIMS